MKKPTFRSIQTMTALAALTLGLSAHAETTKTQLSTATASGAAAIGASAFSLSKFRGAKQVEVQNTQVIHPMNVAVDALGEPKVFSSSELSQLESNLQSGDKVTVIHYLNPEENKKLHLKMTETEIKSAYSSASSHDAMATHYMMPKTDRVPIYNLKGQVSGYTNQMRPPSLSEIVLAHEYQEQAEQERAEARRLERKLDELRTTDAKKLSFIPQEQKIDTRGKSGVTKVPSTMKSFTDRGGQIVKVSRISREAVESARGMRIAGGVGAAVAALAVAGTVEELIYGAGASFIDSKTGVSDRIDTNVAKQSFRRSQ